MPRRGTTATPMRLEFPSELGIDEKESWDALMKRAPIGHFLPVDMPAIIQYCRATTLANRLYPTVRDYAAPPAARAEYFALSRELITLNRLLRIGPSTRNTQRDKAGRVARDHADAFDPATSWQEMIRQGRGGRA